MAGNKSLHDAKKAKKDEFYTRREDIENELSHYVDHFRGKTVYCNCDDPQWSEFWQFFMRNFRVWGLKKLIATHYEPDEKNYAYMLEVCEDTNGDGVVDWRDDPTITQLPCNGDFRSAACIDLLRQADIVVTNPPFSLWREYVDQLMKYEKKFIIIDPQNAITYKEIFPLLMKDRMWLGYGFSHGDAYFRVPPESAGEYAQGVYNPTTGLVHFRNCTWYTNLDIPKRHELIDLRGNYFDPDKYPEYDNMPGAINVDKIQDIPCDYEGIMGVPITFMQSYNPDQFEILGLSRDMNLPGKTGMKEKFINTYFEQGGSGQIMVGHPDLCFFKEGKAIVPYRRVMIRRRKEQAK